MFKRIIVIGALFLAGIGAALLLFNSSSKTPSTAATGAMTGHKKTSFKLEGSIYAGWMPWYYADKTGILKKWADKYGIEITFENMSYGDSLTAYNGGADACLMTNFDLLAQPAKSGVDSTVVIMGDYSNGNDAVLTRHNLALKDLKGKQVYIVQGTCSELLIARGLEMAGLSTNDVTFVSVNDETTIPPAFRTDQSQLAVVTWNPYVLKVAAIPGVTNIFDSSKIPGEIQDLLVVNSKVLNENPDFARALTGAWFEVMQEMNQHGAVAEKAGAAMAKLTPCPPSELQAQLQTTNMFYTPTDALKFTRSQQCKDCQDTVRKFCATHGFYDAKGAKITNPDHIGISYPDGSIQGNPANVKMRYDDRFMQADLDGKL